MEICLQWSKQLCPIECNFSLQIHKILMRYIFDLIFFLYIFLLKIVYLIFERENIDQTIFFSSMQKIYKRNQSLYYSISRKCITQNIVKTKLHNIFIFIYLGIFFFMNLALEILILLSLIKNSNKSFLRAQSFI